MCVYCKLQYTCRKESMLLRALMDCSPEEDKKAEDHTCNSAKHQNNASVINRIQAQKKLAAEERKAAQEHNAAV